MVQKTAIFISGLVISAVLIGCGGGSSRRIAPASGAGQPLAVVLESPAPGTVRVPLAVQATATSPNGISGWVVYVDDQPTFQANNYSDSLATSVALPGGSHKLYVRAWDQAGAGFATSPTMQITVEGQQASVSQSSTSVSNSTPAPAAAPAAAAPPPPPPAPHGPLPSIPGHAQVWTNIQNMDAWESCSDCAGGQAVTSNFWTAGWESSPSMSGSSREFFIGGPPWASALWIKKLGAHNGAWHFLWDFWVRFDPTSAANAWTAEYDFWQSMGGREYMIGSHCNFGEGDWEIWDSKNFSWVPTSIPCPRFSPDTWHHIQWYVERWDKQYHYGILVVDGKVYNLNRTFDINWSNWADNMGVQWQLDQSGSGAPLHEWVDNARLAVW